jgi:uncharacterized membrane protein (DUF485 family)
MSNEETEKGHHRIDYPAFEETPKFKELRKRQRGFVIPVLLVAMAWYFLYVALAVFASNWMATPVPGLGVINIGLVFGLLQFVSTFAITMWYVSFANKRLDPLATELRHELEAKQKAGVA